MVGDDDSLGHCPLSAFAMETKNIITTLERRMKCAMGVCGHCHFDDELIRADGPVFTGSELPGLEKL